ncbi:hypothetical protein [Calothrix rhizosoleniae]|nr:hypothetical protein [Calothrix rhizosoleniae]
MKKFSPSSMKITLPYPLTPIFKLDEVRGNTIITPILDCQLANQNLPIA